MILRYYSVWSHERDETQADDALLVEALGPDDAVIEWAEKKSRRDFEFFDIDVPVAVTVQNTATGAVEKLKVEGRLEVSFYYAGREI